MSATKPAPSPSATMVRWAQDWRRRAREQTIISLLILLVALVALLDVIRPGMVSLNWISSTLLYAAPLGILAAGQTLVMLTGGIDLSVAAVATAAGYVMASQATAQGDARAVFFGLGIAAAVGLVNGIGVGVLRVQPLIMTLGMSLVVAGFLTVYQVLAVASAAAVPGFVTAVGSGTSLGFIPNSLVLWVPIAALVIWGLRRSGYGRLLYAVGDNPTAARLAGVRVWEVLVVDYVLSGLLAGIAGIDLAGLTSTATIDLGNSFLLPSIAAVVIGGTSIFGGRGGYGGSIVGALILTVLVSLLTIIDAPEPFRQVLYGAIILGVAAAYTRVVNE